MTKSEIDEEKQWEIEHNAHTLKEAEMIKADKKRFADAQAYLKKEMAALKRVTIEDEERKRFPNTYKTEEDNTK